jgi:hypothetical protein
MAVKEIGWKARNWIDLAQRTGEHDNEHLGLVKF